MQRQFFEAVHFVNHLLFALDVAAVFDIDFGEADGFFIKISEAFHELRQVWGDILYANMWPEDFLSLTRSILSWLASPRL